VAGVDVDAGAIVEGAVAVQQVAVERDLRRCAVDIDRAALAAGVRVGQERAVVDGRRAAFGEQAGAAVGDVAVRDRDAGDRDRAVGDVEDAVCVGAADRGGARAGAGDGQVRGGVVEGGQSRAQRDRACRNVDRVA
jgi:hypothetical protein